jgi:hypothetical protein
MIINTSPVDIVRHVTTQNQSNLSSLNSMTFYLSSALGMTYEWMTDKLIYQQMEWHYFYTILKRAYPIFAFQSLGLFVLAFSAISQVLMPAKQLILIRF